MGDTRTIDVDYLARVEGEGAMHIEIEEDQLRRVELEIFEPPRFFEGFMRGRHYAEAPDITARICGICPVAYQMSSSRAMEQILGLEIPEPIRELRRLLYCGEWIESHGIHMFMLHAPDFLGYESAIHMAEDHPEIVKKGLRIKKIGNGLMALMAGREIHPINVRVGGFYSVPTRGSLESMREDLEWAADAAEETLQWASTLEYPNFEQDYEFVALQEPERYPLVGDRLVSNKGLDIPISEFNRHISEEQAPHTTTFRSRIRGRGAYLAGPMARFSLNFDRLTPRAQRAARRVGLSSPCRNPFKSIMVRGVEVLYACEEALGLIDRYEQPDRPALESEPAAGVGHGCTEAPRGILYHRYELDEEGLITEAQIVPPTAQNQLRIEEDLRNFVPRFLDLSDEELQWRCEQAIRNYDPCISCSTHFLDLTVDRS